MSFFDDLKKAFASDPHPKATPVPRQEPPASMENTENAEPGADSPKVSLDDKSDFAHLVSFYKDHKEEQEVNFGALVLSLNPDATAHRCPYCSTVHEFKATRARKCPACSEKMVVRQGVFVTEAQASQMEALIQKAYAKQFLVNSLGNHLESAQAAKVNKRKVDQSRAMAEAFRYTALIDNAKDSDGLSYWDKAWGYYNKARLEEMRTVSASMLEYSVLPDIMWDMAQMLRDQANSRGTEDAKKRDRKMALHYACMTLAESARLGADIYFAPELYTFAKERMEEIGTTSEEFRTLAASIATKMRLSGAPLSKYESDIRDLEAYEVIRPFQA